MNIPIFIIDAFTDGPFRGNPAAVCILASQPGAGWMQALAKEMNQGATAFLWRADDSFHLRWYTRAGELTLCGHGTLASAHFLWERNELPESSEARFHTPSGLLVARKKGNYIELDFPVSPVSECAPPTDLLRALSVDATFTGKSREDYFVEVASESDLRQLRPNLSILKTLDMRGVIVTCRSEQAEFDFVSRFFAPKAGIDEDSVTGSAHCALASYWGKQLNKEEMVGFQASERSGIVRVRQRGERVYLLGNAVTVVRGELSEASLR